MRGRLFACAGLLGLGSIAVHADDIEIYSQSVGNNVYRPNVLLIVDSSASMRTVDSGSEARIDQLRSALQEVIGSVDGINLGLMRFKNPGGTVVYPVTASDEPLAAREVIKRISGNSDIAVESHLIQSDDEDADAELAEPSLLVNPSKVLVTQAAHRVFTGLRFTGLQLPPGAVIEHAYLTLFSRNAQKNEDQFRLKFRVDERADSPPFSDESNALGVRARFRAASDLTENVLWKGNLWPKGSDRLNAKPLPANVDLRPLVQKLVDRDDWTTGSPVTLLLKARDQQGLRYIATTRLDSGPESANLNSTLEPILNVRYRLPDDHPLADSPPMTTRDALFNELESFTLSGDTPIADTLLEGYRYFNGWPVIFGQDRGSGDNAAVNRVSHRDAIVSPPDIHYPDKCLVQTPESIYCKDKAYQVGDEPPRYQTPITDTCERNYIVLFSDGEPYGTADKDTIGEITGGTCNTVFDCPLLLSRYMALEPGEENKNRQHRQVTTFTLGYDSDGFDTDYLSELATEGRGGFYAASDTQGLIDAFESIFKDINETNNSFVAPGVTVNQFNRLSHLNSLYFSLFRPMSNAKWPGNLKKYKLVNGAIRDVNSNLAVDPASGSFFAAAHSYWSASADGPVVSAGGAAHQLPAPKSRKVLVNFGGAGALTAIGSDEMDEKLTPALLGLDEDTEDARVQSVRNWIRGLDVTDVDGDGKRDETRAEMGEGLHSQPVLVSYNADDLDAEQASLVVFTANNQGYLHAFDIAEEDSVTEKFAFMPKTLLKNARYFHDNPVMDDHVYGLDGDLVISKNDDDIELFFGMRRGGRNYYAMDVTDIDAPKVNFIIEGGSRGFTKLGQTWSKPIVTKVNLGGSEKRVMIFGGGYDVAQDQEGVRTPNTLGNAVYMVDAATGELLWHASSSKEPGISGQAFTKIDQMSFSIPASISVIDRDHDSLADHLYVSDLGGQVFRIDLFNGKSGQEFADGGRIALLAEDGDVIDNRRFYYSPDVAEVRFADQHYYAVAVGSGYRAHPLNRDTADRMYILKDLGVFGVTVNDPRTVRYDDRTHADLYNATAHQVRDEDQLLVDGLTGKKGWYLEMSAGEKILSRAVIVNHRVAFTSYIPFDPSQQEESGRCLPREGGGRLYLMDLVTSEAIIDVNRTGELDAGDRWQNLHTPGIPPSPRIIYPEGGQPMVCVSTECGDAYISPGDDNQACENGELACLTRGFFADRNRVIKGRWHSGTERVSSGAN